MKIKIYQISEREYLCHAFTSELLLFNNEEEAKEELREQGVEDAFMEKDFEFHNH